MRLLLMGAPASGKGTVAEGLVDILNIKTVSPGRLLRQLPESHPKYAEVNDAMEKGILAPYQLTADLLKEELEKDTYKNGFILDGWMRNLDQKNYFDPKPDWVVYIKISDNTAIRRISGRRLCEDTGETFNIYTFSEEDLEKFKDCKNVIHREDDKEETVRKRLEVYHTETIPVVEHYREQGNLLEIDGEGSPDEVLNLVVEKIREVNDKN